MSFSENTTRPQEMSILFLASELQELNHLVVNNKLEHELMLIAKWVDPYFVLEACIFSIDSENNDIREETESDLNTSYIVADEEDLDNILESIIDMMPTIDEISGDTGYNIRAHTTKLFQQMQEHVKTAKGLLRLGIDVSFTKESIRLNRWVSFITDKDSEESLSVVEEHSLQHNFL